MSIFDFVIIFIVGICFLSSFYKGILREFFSFVGYLVGYILAKDYYEELAIYLQSMVSQEIMVRISEFALIFIILKIFVALFIFLTVKFSFGLLGRLIRKSVSGSSVINFPDRIMGGLIGGLKGLVIVAILMFPLSLFQGVYEKVSHGSIVIPFLEKAISTISKEPYVKKYLDLPSEFSVDVIQEKIKKMGDLDDVMKDIKVKKNEILDSIQELEINGPKDSSMEKYTKDDKSKLNEIIKKFSAK
jgi:membrane protein required for colicin V production